MMQFSHVIPILRIFDEAKARTFYIDFLGFSVDWEHRFEPEMPLYMQISKGGIQLHLSEHHGDCCPGAGIRINMNGVRELQKELVGKQYAYARPGLEKKPWNTEECTVTDPFGNRLVFCEYL